MIFRKLAAATVGFALFATVASADDFKRIKTEVGFRKAVVDRVFGNETGSGTYNANGTLTGKFGGQELSGKWIWTAGHVCRTAQLGDKDLGTDCQRIEYKGKTLRVTRDKGEGKSVLYELK
ncbi:hypothetical protein [Actibacterium lipolyticum]|uniref:DUF995 domain-containing protein n=1 Tax=Actibacterium lipolyticum TaxID=1524263 RepID=A0A238KRN0_9RHOB|nr:hypothetical protein [Actibacterium lipolyticum]SMX45388.1 hypothetical protein COL8621_02783 [Actibacterium lipolyticum]